MRLSWKGKNRLRFNFKAIYIIKIGVDNLPPRAKLERTKKVFVSWKNWKTELGKVVHGRPPKE